MDTQSKSSSVAEDSKTSTESATIKSNKSEDSSNSDIVRISPRTGRPMRRYTKNKEEKAKPVDTVEAEILTEEQVTSVDLFVKEPKKPLPKVGDPIIEKTHKETLVVIDEKELKRLREIDYTVRELLIGANSVCKYVGYGKSLSVPDTKEEQEGAGVRRLRELTGVP